MSIDEHWKRLGPAVKRRVLGQTLVGLRLHTLASSIPKELRLQLLDQVRAELEAEGTEKEGERER